VAPSPTVLIPCSDDWVRTLAEAPQTVKNGYPSSIPPAAALARLLDKGLFGELLRARGIPHPQTLLVGGEEPAEGEWPEGRFFIKPRDSQAFLARYGVKAFWPETEEETREQLANVREAGLEVVLQEYVPGPPSNHYFVDGFMDSGGRVRAVFVRQRLRMFPTPFGNSSYMVSRVPDSVGQAMDDLTRLLEELEYRGVFSAEFKRDERDGAFKLLEVNARPWWFVEFAANCGVNVVEMAYRDALGDALEKVASYWTGKYLIHPYFDFFACMAENPSRVGAVSTFLRSLPGARQPALCWDDPLPGISAGVELATGFVARRLRGLPRK
jgi:predicted ATP-grasp superfamily ATP-dependent carboligase